VLLPPHAASAAGAVKTAPIYPARRIRMNNLMKKKAKFRFQSELLFFVPLLA
jgi:hypothetical protein